MGNIETCTLNCLLVCMYMYILYFVGQTRDSSFCGSDLRQLILWIRPETAHFVGQTRGSSFCGSDLRQLIFLNSSVEYL